MSHAYWYATRGSGVVALVLLTLVVVLGIAGTLRLRSQRWPRFVVNGLHRNVTLLTLAFLAVHVITTVLDSFTPIGLKDAFVPFLASYRPLWLGLGAVAFDLLLALTVTSLLRARIGFRTWRALHWLAYAAWPVALVHGLGTGSDARFGWLQALTAACVATVAFAAVRRLSTAGASPALRLGGAGAGAALLVAGFVWYVDGPGAPHWASRSGTPTAVGARAVVPATRTAARVTSSVMSTPFRTSLRGRIASRADANTGLVRVDIRGRTTGRVPALLWIRLQGVPVDGGGVSLNASGAAFGPLTAPNAYVGKVTALDGTQLALALHDASGAQLALQVQLSVDQTTRRVTGTIEGSR